ELAAKPRTAIRLNKERWRHLTQAAAEEAAESAKRAHAAAFASGEPQVAMERFLARRRPKG
ncbi:MAG: enoyl-CoA hydratase/isomerase family protein, partial [Armatimonadetes bacterium]|nr:enoyl-CoA hydratase/isomerase family protein [Armatimonadota bacterium]